MKKNKLKIDLGEYLKSPIPTNVIFFKNLTGIGATHNEIKAPRNSIIIEANIPVIHGKTNNHEGLLGVYETVSKQDVITYLKTASEYKKIFTTPESLYKVIGALEDQQINFYETYFMLIDECDKLTKDVDYRRNILEPLKYFFAFKNKAFVSATALIPTDPRFEENNFEIISVEPTYKIEKEINIISTNYSLSTFHKLIENSEAEKIFIFLNSVVGIAKIIKSLKIDDQSSIFTSTSAKDEFYDITKEVFPNHLSDVIDNTKLSRYNFLTSRYFSAVDIDLEEKVDIIMISDISQFQYSLLSPQTDVIQIIGRLRKKEFISSIFFIINLTLKPDYVSKKVIEEIFDFGKKLRDIFETAIMSTTSMDFKKHLTELIKINGDKSFFNEDFKPNHFMMDNYRLDNDVKKSYRSTESFVKSFKDTKILDTDKNYFIVNHTTEKYKISTIDIKLVSAQKPFKERFDSLIRTMDKIQEIKRSKLANKFNIDNSESVESKIIRDFNEMYEIYLNEGKDKLYEIGASHERIKKYYYLNYDNSHLNNFPLIQKLYNTFEAQVEYIQDTFLDDFFKICSEYNPNVKRDIYNVERFFKIKRFRKRVNSSQKRMIKIIKNKFDVVKER
ncbi:hypothetical protein [Sphingobacterium hungaricum]